MVVLYCFALLQVWLYNTAGFNTDETRPFY